MARRCRSSFSSSPDRPVNAASSRDPTGRFHVADLAPGRIPPPLVDARLRGHAGAARDDRRRRGDAQPGAGSRARSANTCWSRPRAATPPPRRSGSRRACSTANRSPNGKPPRSLDLVQGLPGLATARTGGIGSPGLGLRARRRIALRAHPGRRRAREPAGRQLRLRQRAAVRAGARRGRARRGEQPVRHRRAGRRRPARDASGASRRTARLPRRGRGRQLRLRSASRRGPRAAPGSSTGTLACCASTPTTRCRTTPSSETAGAASAGLELGERTSAAARDPRRRLARWARPGRPPSARRTSKARFDRSDVVARRELAPRARDVDSTSCASASRGPTSSPATQWTRAPSCRSSKASWARFQPSTSSIAAGLPERHPAPFRGLPGGAPGGRAPPGDRRASTSSTRPARSARAASRCSRPRARTPEATCRTASCSAGAPT